MTHYVVDNELEDDVVGAFPQVDCSTMAQAHFITSWHLFDPVPNLKFELAKGARLTDVLSDLSISSTGFLVGPRAREILARHHLMRHQYFPAEVRSGGDLHDYAWLHLSEPALTRQLDYQRSSFYRTEYTFREEAIELASYERYEELKSRDTMAAFGVGLDEIVLSADFDRGLDMFTFLPFDHDIYISERLHGALIGAGIDGLRYEKTGRIKFADAGSG